MFAASSTGPSRSESGHHCCSRPAHVSDHRFHPIRDHKYRGEGPGASGRPASDPGMPRPLRRRRLGTSSRRKAGRLWRIGHLPPGPLAAIRSAEGTRRCHRTVARFVLRRDEFVLPTVHWLREPYGHDGAAGFDGQRGSDAGRFARRCRVGHLEDSWSDALLFQSAARPADHRPRQSRYARRPRHPRPACRRRGYVFAGRQLCGAPGSRRLRLQ